MTRQQKKMKRRKMRQDYMLRYRHERRGRKIDIAYNKLAYLCKHKLTGKVYYPNWPVMVVVKGRIINEW